MSYVFWREIRQNFCGVCSRMLSQKGIPTKCSNDLANQEPQVTLEPTRKCRRHEEGTKTTHFLKCKKLSPDAVVPTLGSEVAAGYDLYAAHDEAIPRRGRALINTDIAISMPPGCYGRVAPRSGLAWKHGLDVGAGVIDPDYRGNVGVVMFNLSDNIYNVKKGDRIAQLVLEKFVSAGIEEVEELTETGRGSGGYGSTGH